MGGSSGVEFLREFGFLTEHQRKAVLVGIPIGDGTACHTAVDGCLGNSSTHLADEAWVNGFRNEIVATKLQVIHLIYIVHHVGNGLLGKIGNSMNGSHLHLLVDGSGVNVERTTENVREADDIVDLVRVVGAAC